MKKSYFYAGISILCWSTMSVTAKLLLGELNNLQLLWTSSLFAGLFLFFVAFFTGKLKIMKNYTMKDYINLILIGIPGTFFYFMFYYAGTDRMPASQAFIINYLWPIMSIIFACIILKEKMTLRKAIAVIISFLGVIIVTCGELADFDKEVILGAGFCILGAVSYGIHTAFNQKMNYDKCISMMVSYLAAFVLTTLVNMINRDLFVPSTIQTLGFAWNGIFTMAVASTTWMLALETKGSTAKISNLAYITPFLSLAWTSLVLKEELNIYFVAGLVVIILGIFIQLKEKSNTETQNITG